MIDPDRVVRTASLMLAVLLAGSCTDAFLQPPPVVPANGNDRLTLQGRVCTHPPDPSGFPVKVVLIVDQSGSMCVSDPPGSQNASGFCQQLPNGVVPPGVTEPARVRAAKQLIAQFQADNARGADVEIAVIPFETNIQTPWPSTPGTHFARPDGTVIPYLSALQSQLGKGTDYQGALAEAYNRIASDIQAQQIGNPSILPRSRYVVVFLTDGTPYPRCSANDNLPPGSYADPDRPWLIWPDSFDAQDFCNLTDPNNPNQITGFIPGTDRNQNYQLFNLVDRIMTLKDQFNVGDIRLHTVLLLNITAVQLCGSICQDLYGSYPPYSAATYPYQAKKIAGWLLNQMASRGNGIFQEFDNGNIQNLGLGALNYASLAAPNVMKTLLLQPLRAEPRGNKRDVDSDGDGLFDDVDSAYNLKTSPYIADTDGDCFDDRFEASRTELGFDPTRRDSRGCDPNSPITPGCTCQDTDGDGLSQFAESYLSTNSTLVDSDGDGVPDGIEAKYRLDPLAPTVGSLDTDGDGVPDRDEILAGTDPTVPDRDLFQREGFQYEAQEVPQPDGSNCYDFTISNIGLITPPAHAGVGLGYNLFKLWFAEAPKSGVATDYGNWKVACAWARYSPPSLRTPAGPNLTLLDSNFVSPPFLQSDTDYVGSGLCVGSRP